MIVAYISLAARPPFYVSYDVQAGRLHFSDGRPSVPVSRRWNAALRTTHGNLETSVWIVPGTYQEDR